MKKLFNYSFILLAMLGVMFTSCKKDHYDEPPIQDLPVGQVYTIEQILALESGFVFNEDASVYGTITADEVSGNLYKAAFMQDPETGKAIELYLNATSGVRIGDRVRIYLKGVTYALYNGLPQLSNFEPDGHIIIEANNQPIQPLETTIAEICNGNIAPGAFVKLKHVKFTDKNTFADPTAYGERTLVDSADYTNQVKVRTSNYANFANDSLPQGTGELTAIASIYKNEWQLMIRSARELKFDGYTPDELPYYQDFTSSFGTYSTYNVTGNQEWGIDYKTAKMTGYENSTNFANEDWLISSRFSLENVSSASLTMSYIARYFNDLNNDITIQVSSDYTSGDPTLATWTAVPATWTSGSDWSTFASTVVDLSQFVGQKVTVAVKYLSDDVKAGTIEVKSILIQEGSGPTPPPGPGGDVQSLPYTQSFTSEFGTYTTYDIAGSQQWNIDYSTAKMTGYDNSVNYANEDWLISSPVAITGVSSAKFSMTYIARYFNSLNDDITLWASSDYVYGSDPTTATWNQIRASWTSGSNWTDFTTTDVSLADYVGQTVTFAVKYLSTDIKAGTIEIQSITISEGGSPTPPPGPGGDVQALPYTQNFSSEFGSYTTYDIAGSQQWTIDYSTAKMTGYENATNYANEDWLISSPVAITGVSDAKFTMTYIARYFSSLNNDITLWASSNYVYGSNPTTATWNQVAASWTSGSNWTDFATTEVSLTEYVGQTVTFAVKYLSTDVKAGTIEIQSITIQEGSGVTPPTPPTPPTPGGSGTADDPYNVGSGITLQGQDVVAWVQGYIVGAVKSGLSSVSSNADINWTAPFDLATNVLIADDPTCQEVSSCVIVNLPSGKPLRTQVNLMDNPGNLGKLLAVNGKLRTYFGQAGLRDSGGTTNDFVLEGGSTPPTPPTPPQGIFSETFATDQGSFNIVDVNLPQGLNYVWSHYDNANCMKGSAYYQQAYEAESWLVSPAIDLSGVSAATLSFEHAVNYNTDPQSALTVMVSTNYNGNVASATWNELTLSAWPDGESWTFVTATASLNQYAGQQQVTIAFKYTSTSSTASTWEIRNLIVE